MDNRRRPRIPDAEWESRKETIHHLYMEQDRRLEGSDGVMKIMETTYGFSASKAQYETRLKRWHFRKYAKKDDWLALSHVLGSRKREGKDTDVLFNGELVRPDRVRKETRRHRRQGDHLYSQVQELPSYMRVRTPPQHNVALRREGRLTLSPRYSPYPLPSPRLVSAFGTPPAIVATTEECTMNTFHDLDFLSLPRIFDTWNTLPNNQPFHEQSTGLSLLELDTKNDLENFQRRGETSNYHIAHDSSTFMDPAFALNSMPGLVTRNAYTLPNFQTSMEQLFQRMLPGVGPFIRSLHIPDSVLSEFSVKRLCYSSNSQLQNTRAIHVHILHLVFSLLVNNQATPYYGDDSEPAVNKICQAGVDYICSLDSNLLSDILDMTPYPYGTALHLGLIRAAADLQAVGAVEVILERHFNPAMDVDLGEINGWASFPLLVHPKILRVLLKRGVDPEFIVKILLQHWIGRIWAAPMTLKQRKPPADVLQQILLANLEIFEQLLQDGTSLGAIDMSAVLFYGPVELISIILKYCTDQFEETFISNRGLIIMIDRKDWDHRLDSVLRTILEFGVPSTSSNGWKDVLAASLSIAVLSERAEAINLLLAAGALPNSNCLFHAVITKNIRLFQQCLDLGADPNTLYRFDIREIGFYFRDRLPDPPKGTALSECIRQGNKEAIQMLTEKGYIEDLRNKVSGFKLALIAACRAGDKSLVHHLLSLGNDHGRESKSYSESQYWDRSDDDQPIVAAVESGSEVIIRQLLSAEFAPDCQALLKAIRERQASIVELLISVVRFGEYFYQSAKQEMLFEATRWGNINVIKALIQAGFPLNTQGFFNLSDMQDWTLPERLWDRSDKIQWEGTALSMAILTGNSEVTKLLLKSGADLNTREPNQSVARYEGDLLSGSDVWLMTPLTACVVRGDLKFFQDLLCRGADPFDNSAIYIASVLEQDNYLNLLLGTFAQRYPHGARGFGSDALFHAILSDNSRMFELLVKSVDAHNIIRASAHRDTNHLDNYVSPFGEALLQYHRHCGHCDALQIFLQRQEDPNSIVCSKDSRLTALHFAIELESLEITKLLVEAGANLSSPHIGGEYQTPLQAAARKGCKKIVQYLLQQGADPNEAPGAYRGATALQYAAIHGSTEVANLLLDKHAKVNADPAMFCGRTAFEGAAEQGRIEMMLVLFQRGADLLANDRRQHHRAVQFATKNNQIAAKRFADELLETAIQNERSRQFVAGDVDLAALDMDIFGDFFSLS